MARATRAGLSQFQPMSPVTLLLLLAPALAAATAFFIIPMSAIVVSSMSDANARFSFSNFTEILGDSFYWNILLRTVRVSAFTTIAALIISYPAALYLYFSESGWRRYFLLIAVSPLFISVVVRSYGWIVILSPNGALNAIFHFQTSFRLLGTELAIIIGLTHIYVPFMLLSLNASLSKVDKQLLSAAASLGASSFQAFKDVVLPLSLPGVIGGSTIVFTISMTAFSTPILLGGSLSKTMPYLIYQRVMLMFNWRMGSALALFLLVATIILVFMLARGLRLMTKYAAP